MSDWKESMKNKRVCFYVAETFPSFSGSGLNAFRFAKYLSDKFENVGILCYNYNKNRKETELIDQVYICRIPYYNKNIISKIYSFPLLIYSYFRTVKNNDIALLVGKYLVGYEFIILFSLLLKKEIIYRSTLLGDDDIESILQHSSFVLKPIRKYLFSKISRYHSINEEFKNIWEQQYQQRIPLFLGSQGVSSNEFYPQSKLQSLSLRKKYSFPEGRLLILSVGILIERKGYREIIESLSQLELPYLYIVAGAFSENEYHRSSSEEKKEMKNLHEFGTKKLGNKVLFLDNQNDMLSLYSCSDIVIHGANREGLPNSILEAMACRKAIICKRLNGLDFLLRDKHNTLIFNNFSEMNEKVLLLAKSKALAEKIAENGYKTILENSTFKSIAEGVFI